VTSWLAALSLAAAVAMSGRRRPAERLRIRREGSVPADPMPSGAGLWLAAAVIGSAVVALRAPPVPLVIAAIAGVVAVRVRRSAAAARAREQRAAATVEITFALAGELRAGRTPAQALAAVAGLAGPLRAALEAACAAVAVGADPAAELERAALLPGAERLRYVAAAWAVAASAGGRVAVVLERLSEAMDSDDELRQELESAMAGPRATMVLLAGLPLLGLLLGQSVGAHPVRFLIDRPLGWGLLAVAALLDGLGVLVTRAIARRALRP
jgi:tight adherence protein B